MGKLICCLLAALTLFFQYSLDEYVVTPFDHVGIVYQLGYDHSGAFYRVQTCYGPMVFREWQIRAWKGAK